MGRRADERDHLMLQILLLTEKEITAVLNVDCQIASRVGAENAANTAEVHELSQHTSIEDVAQTIRENLDEEVEARGSETFHNGFSRRQSGQRALSIVFARAGKPTAAAL